MIPKSKDDLVEEQLPTSMKAIGHGIALGVSCLVTSGLTLALYRHVHFVAQANALLGVMWATIATVFVQHISYTSTLNSVVSRMLATIISVVLCLVYLLLFPFHIWGLALVIALGAIATTLVGRPNEQITTGITTTVVLVVGAILPEHRWEQPILRLVETVIGAAVGVAGGWLEAKLMAQRFAHSSVALAVAQRKK